MALVVKHPFICGIDLVNKERKIKKKKDTEQDRIEFEGIELLAFELPPRLHVKTGLHQLYQFRKRSNPYNN
ncbi:MAG: hypothetical protein K0S32_4346 [Bacteroidetes bacterium]|jgi:hypothetical protein|nr:hypothetical protein [Bacteroidota bacterium]